MRFSSRSRMSVVLSLITVITLFSMLLVTGVFFARANSAHAAASGGTSAVAATAAKAATVNFASLPGAASTSSQPTHVIPFRPIHPGGGNHAGAPAAAEIKTSDSHQLLHNFNGLSAPANEKVNGFDVEPPDQGLCVGNGFVVEPINLAISVFRPNGTVVSGPKSLPAFFHEPPAFTPPAVIVQGDPRCFFDASTGTFFATQLFLTTALKHNVSHFDVAVNTSGNPTTAWTVFRFDTTDLNNPGCPCFGDQPLFGIDQFNIYISTNEFPISVAGFNGAQIYAISKSDLIAMASKVHFVHFGNLGIGGTIAASVQPAINVGSAPAEFFLNSLDPFATFDNRIGVWAMTNRQVVSSGGTPTLSNKVIHSETYGQPPLATDPSGFRINTDDDRMQQVQFINGQLWSSLDTAATIPGESGVRSAAAWFEIHPFLSGNMIGGASITDQGFVVSHGNFLLYPAVAAAPDGTAAMTMTLMGPLTFASAVFAVRPAGSGHHDFSAIRFAAAGVAPDHGFTCTDPATGKICRWGDYSAAVIDPSGSGIWLATEYIPGAGDKFANFGTRVFEVAA